MKKELTLNGLQEVPVSARLMNEVSKKSLELLNKCLKCLPADCQVKTASDGWYVGTIAATCLTFLFPPALALVAYCFYRAKKAEKGGAR